MLCLPACHITINQCQRTVRTANTYKHHHLGLELMVKLRTSLHSFLKLKFVIMERGVTFLMQLVVFGQSQCTVPVGQSEQTVLVGRRDFVENEAFERRGIEDLQ